MRVKLKVFTFIAEFFSPFRRHFAFIYQCNQTICTMWLQHTQGGLHLVEPWCILLAERQRLVLFKYSPFQINFSPYLDHYLLAYNSVTCLY